MGARSIGMYANAFHESGRKPNEHWDDLDYAPVLMCPCGDPCCGAIVTRRLVESGHVTWTDWALDNFHDPDGRVALDLEFRFDAADYEAVVAEAEVLSQSRAKLLSSLSVWDPMGGWRRWLFSRLGQAPSAYSVRVDTLADEPELAGAAALLSDIRVLEVGGPASSSGAGRPHWDC